MDDIRISDAFSVFTAVTASDMSYAQFRYKHLENPESDGFDAALVRYDGDRPCATNSFLQSTLLYNGTPLPVLQSCDSAVLPSHRGRGLFSDLIRSAQTRCAEGSPQLIFGLPNGNSYPGLIKLGFTDAGTLEERYAILHPLHLGTRKLLHRQKPYAAFEETRFFDSSHHLWQSFRCCPFSDAELARLNSRPGVYFSRTRAMFEWKLDRNPASEFLYWKVTKDSALQAYFILKKSGPSSCRLCDWAVLDTDAVPLLRTLRRCCRSYCDLLTVPMVHPQTEEAAWFSAAGFPVRKGVELPLVLFPTGAEDCVWHALSSGSAWHLRYFDADTILN